MNKIHVLDRGQFVVAYTNGVLSLAHIRPDCTIHQTYFGPYKTQAGQQKEVIYEHLEKRALDHLLFDPSQKVLLTVPGNTSRDLLDRVTTSEQ